MSTTFYIRAASLSCQFRILESSDPLYNLRHDNEPNIRSLRYGLYGVLNFRVVYVLFVFT